MEVARAGPPDVRAALDHIRFTSEQECERARAKFIEHNVGSGIGVSAFCVHDDG